MPDLMMLFAVGSAATLGFTIAGVAGFGGGVVILPVLVWVLGPREAIPILSVAQFIASVVRFLMYRQDTAWPVVRWFSVGAIPVAILASLLYVQTPADIFVRFLGCGMLALVVYRYTPWGKRAAMKLRGFIFVGGATSFFSGYLGIGGPVPAPFLIAYGLVGSAYVGTMGCCTMVTQFFKLIVFGSNALLTPYTMLMGLGIGAISWVGAYLARHLVHRLPRAWFIRVIEGMLIASGLLFLLRG
ncbi:MAG: hypothetical protein ETSY2_29355 [Candidatus Entotheonella gemina]|uniref:Probable membrane transporter protein n=1 Tax=Candidatus Entotheonella gemina TaxID=1429439 RepID=W4M330_9BACT|nr:MAG: hypothetical protein ETSY2_29355 [Candidatus Entotheonella gemina]